MGKRKERRLAALSAAGRRVKLDLFAEPSGDLGGFSVHSEVGEELNHNGRAGVPISPSSSGKCCLLGKRQENPLLLLGQYSDEELDEEGNGKLKDDVVGNSLKDFDDEVKGPENVECEDPKDNSGKDLASLQVKQLESEGDSASLDAEKSLDGNEIGESDDKASVNPCSEVDASERTVPETSSVEVIGDLTGGWNMVMHEESNQYYYWNTLTGETSWEVPDVLAKGTELTNKEKVPVTKEVECASADGYVLTQNLEGEVNNDLGVTHVNGCSSRNFISSIKGKLNHGLPLEKWNEECTGIKDSTVAVDEAKNESQMITSECHEEEDALSLCVMKYGETLLEKLKALKGSNNYQKGNEWMEKHILEVEIRLSDFKSLLSYGSSLHPFWVHSEVQLKRLECAINDEVSLHANYEKMDEANAVDISYIGNDITNDTSSQCIKGDFEADREEKMAISSHENHHGASSPNSNFSNIAHISPSGSPTGHLDSGIEGNSEGNREISATAELILKSVPHIVEDVDMDVDMEVDDSSLENKTLGDSFSAEYFLPTEHIIQPNPVLEFHSSAPEEFSAPPPPDEPPDEDWIPPPPPESEPAPPPPPDEPPSLANPPPPLYSETVQLLPYSEQYNICFTDPNIAFYGHTITGVPSVNYYPQADGCQGAEPQPPVYYGTVPSSYPDAASTMVNPAGPVMYYDLQNGTVPPGSVTANLESCGFHSESGSLSYHDATGSEQGGSVEVFAGSGCLSLSSSQVKSDVSALGHESEVEPSQVKIPSATIQATSTVSVSDSAPAASTAAVTTSAPLVPAAKAESKVMRSKKRTVAPTSTLRSNKKVSSLVDKWKAAKEELQEDEEDEPENAYEMLEKKRQREIEEWRAKQIASGEAKDNANFQPLGGDWRERVKRKRAQMTGESVNAKQQPDLVKLSRDLPSGWQAYWDESTREVYYGNLVTSETTWIRPKE